MSPNEIFLSAISLTLIISNIWTYRYMKGRMKILETTGDKSISIQSTVVDNLIKYSNTITPEDFEKRLRWKIEDLQEKHSAKIDKITNEFKNQLNTATTVNKSEIIDQTIRDLNKELGGWLLSYNEVSRVIVHNIRKQFENKSKEERNEFLYNNYPHSAKDFIEILDFSGDTSQITRF